MTIISTEMLKWKRNKTVLGIFILTAILGIFAVERAFSISRSSSLMNSFSDLYTLAFKNLTSLFLPIVLSMFATTLFFDEQKNDTLKGLLIIPISKTQLYFSKIAVVIFMSLALCLLTFAICILGGFLAGGFTDLNTETILQAGLLFLAGGVLVPLAMLPVIIGKGICSTDWGCITLSCACRAYSVGDYGTAPTGECYGNLSLYFI